MSIFEEIKQSYKQGSTLHKLIYINVGVFLALHVVVIFLVLFNQMNREAGISQILDYLAVPSDLGELARKPWTPVTYMFTHSRFYHILFNMYILFWFGRYFIEEFGQKKLLGVYLLGGLAGAALYVLSFNLLPYFAGDVAMSAAIGASASVMAVVVAVATVVPNRKINLMFIGQVKILYLALFIFITSTILDFTDNTGGKIAHIGGALLGYLFAIRYLKGKDVTRGFDHFMDSFSTLFHKKQKMKVTYKKSSDDMEYNRQVKEEQHEIDKILDKISKGGYDSLTKSEKETLFKMKK